jgi:hypothetical protein
MDKKADAIRENKVEDLLYYYISGGVNWKMSKGTAYVKSGFNCILFQLL